MYPYRDTEYNPVYYPAYPFGAIDVSADNMDVNSTMSQEATPAAVAASAINALGGKATVNAAGVSIDTLAGATPFMPQVFTDCWDYPGGVPVWVPGTTLTPVGTPQTGPQCMNTGNNAVPTAVPSPLPHATTQPMPSVVSQGVPNNQLFSPTSLLNPMPQIVAGPKAAPSPCSGLTQWVNDNPVMAAGLLLAGLLFAMRKG